MGVVGALGAEADEFEDAFQVGILEGFERVVEVYRPCVVDDKVDAVQQFLVFGVRQSKVFGAKGDLQELDPWALEQTHVEAFLGESALLAL